MDKLKDIGYVAMLLAIGLLLVTIAEGNYTRFDGASTIVLLTGGLILVFISIFSKDE